MKAKRVGAVVEVARSPIFFAQRQRVADLAVQTGVPMVCAAEEFVEAGCLLFYEARFPDLMRRAAE